MSRATSSSSGSRATGTSGSWTKLSGEHSWTFTKRAWRIEKALSGGGPLMDVGIYPIQAACRAALAQPLAVSARELPKTKPDLFNEVEETIEWTMEFPGRVECSAASSYARNDEFFEARGAKGWVRLSPAYVYRGLKMTTSQGPLDYPDVPQQALQMDDFASCVLTGRETPVPGLHGTGPHGHNRGHLPVGGRGGQRRVEVQEA